MCKKLEKLNHNFNFTHTSLISLVITFCFLITFCGVTLISNLIYGFYSAHIYVMTYSKRNPYSCPLTYSNACIYRSCIYLRVSKVMYHVLGTGLHYYVYWDHYQHTEQSGTHVETATSIICLLDDDNDDTFLKF